MADEIIEAIALAIGGLATRGIDLFWDRMPDEPLECVAFTRYTGRAPERVSSKAGYAYDYPRVQLAVRGADPEAVYARASAIYDALGAYRSPGPVQVFNALGTVGLVRYDANDKPIYGTNFEVVRNL